MAKTQEQLKAELEAAHAKRLKQKEESEQGGGFFTQEHKLPLAENKFVVARVVDMPQAMIQAFIKGDDDKLFPFNFPEKDEDPDFILWQIIDRVLKRTFVGKDAENKAIFSYDNKASHPDVFRIVENNGNTVYGQYGANGWYPTRSYLVNVINRAPFSVKRLNEKGEEETVSYTKDWCYENNHTLLLTKTAKSQGVAATFFNMLMDNIVSNFGPFYNMDLAIKKLKASPWYELHKADTLVANQEVLSQVVAGPMSDRDSKLEVYDLQEMASVTKASVIYSKLKNKIKTIDEGMGTNFLNQLERLVEFEVNDKSKAPVASAPRPEQQQPQVAPQPQPAPAEAPKPRVRVASSPVDAINAIAPMASKLTEAERAQFIRGVEGGKLVFTTNDLASCPDCNKDQPTALEKFCIFCGKTF